MAGNRVSKRALRKFYELLSNRDRIKDEYGKNPRELWQKIGHLYPPKLKKLFDDVYNEKVSKVVAVAPRGGGKTFLAADIATSFFLFKDWNVIIVAGSLEQAQRVTEYIKENLGEPEVVAEIGELYETKTLVKNERSGTWIKAAPASTKAIRGLHSRGRPVLLIMDEEAEMDESIVRAALKTVTEAPKYVIMRISTNHYVTGTFYELVENPERFLYRKYHWDGFDISRIEKMKNGEPDWEYYFEPYVKVFGAEYIKQAIKDLKKYWLQGPRPHGTGSGWAPFRQKVIESFLTDPREWFEVEEMGLKPSGAGQIIKPELIDKAIVDNITIYPYAPVWAGIDWGFVGMTAIVVWQQIGDEIHVIEALHFTHTLAEEILTVLQGFYHKYGLRCIYADASHPFNNELIRKHGFDVTEVSFQQFKEKGIGILQWLFERGKIKIPRGNVEMIRQFKRWHRDKSGRVVKKDDHYPDACVAASKRLDEMGLGTGIGLLPKFRRAKP